MMWVWQLLREVAAREHEFEKVVTVPFNTLCSGVTGGYPIGREFSL